MVFKKYIQTTFKAFFFTDSTEMPNKEASTVSSDEKLVETTETQTQSTIKQHKSTLTGLSKYGPWGYLFLGMLLCGGALLLCGLWGKIRFTFEILDHRYLPFLYFRMLLPVTKARFIRNTRPGESIRISRVWSEQLQHEHIDWSCSITSSIRGS